MKEFDLIGVSMVARRTEAFLKGYIEGYTFSQGKKLEVDILKAILEKKKYNLGENNGYK